MNKLLVIFNELNTIDAMEFVSACESKHRGLYGVPRLAYHKKSNIKTSQVKIFLSKDLDYFKKIDDKFYNIIDENLIENFIETVDYKTIFDLCRLNFDQPDEFFHSLPNKIKKLFNLNTRNVDRSNFIKSNEKHLAHRDTITTKVIYDKLNHIWSNKWGNLSSYLNDYDNQIINNIVNA
jgi:hypothetical protein